MGEFYYKLFPTIDLYPRIKFWNFSSGLFYAGAATVKLSSQHQTDCSHSSVQMYVPSVRADGCNNRLKLACACICLHVHSEGVGET